GHAVADDLAVDVCAALKGMLALLEDDDAGALADDESVTVTVIGPRGLGRAVVEAGRQRAAGGEPGKRQTADRRFGTAGDHHCGVAERDQPRGVADGVRTGRAGGNHRAVRALELVADGHLSGGEVDQAARNEEGADPPRSAIAQYMRGLLDTLQ